MTARPITRPLDRDIQVLLTRMGQLLRRSVLMFGDPAEAEMLSGLIDETLMARSPDSTRRRLLGPMSLEIRATLACAPCWECAHQGGPQHPYDACHGCRVTIAYMPDVHPSRSRGGGGD